MLVHDSEETLQHRHDNRATHLAVLERVASTKKLDSYKGTALRLFELLCCNEAAARRHLAALEVTPVRPRSVRFGRWEWLLRNLVQAGEQSEIVWKTRPLVELTAEHKAHLARRREMSGVRVRSMDTT